MAEAPKSRKRKSSAPLRAVLIILISLVIGLNVYQWNASRLVGNNFPMPLGFGMAVVLSGSMEPSLNVNDLVFVTRAKTYEKGDVVVFQENGSLIIHRIIDVDAAAEKLQTKGDANNAADEPISLTQVKGKASFHIPYIGIVVRALKTPVGVIAVLAAAILLMHGSWKKERASGDEELDAIKDEIRRLKEEQAAETKKTEEAGPGKAREIVIMKDREAPPERQTAIPRPEDDGIDIPL